MPDLKPLSLRARRLQFTNDVVDLLLWARGEGYDLVVDEWTIHSPRKVRNVRNTEKGAVILNTAWADDGTHKLGGKHPEGLAVDLLLYADTDGDGEKDDYVSSGADPRWDAIGAKWLSLRPGVNTWGRSWDDTNHISREER